MRALLLFLLVGFCFILEAQVVFCPKSAEWRYLFLENNLAQQYSYDNERILYARDSLCEGDSVKVLIHTRYFKYFNDHDYFNTKAVTIVKQSGDTIFFRNKKTNHTWVVLYNFNVPVSGSWVSNTMSSATQYTTQVLEKNDTTVNGQQLKRLRVKMMPPGYESNHWSDTVTIVERMGADKFLFYFMWSDNFSDGDGFVQSLCYEDESLGIAKYSSLPCDYDKPLDVKGVIGNQDVNLFPSPAVDFLNLSGSGLQDAKVDIVDIAGSCLSSQGQLTASNQIEVKYLPPGIYFLIIRRDGGPSTLVKFVKN